MSKITIDVTLNNNNLPEKIVWKSEKDNTERECKAFLLSLFEKQTLDTLKIDLWTNEMLVMEMDRFFFQTLRALADTYHKATHNTELANDMQRFVQYFGEKIGVIGNDT